MKLARAVTVLDVVYLCLDPHVFIHVQLNIIFVIHTLQDFYGIEYKLIGIQEVIIEYIEVGRTEVNAHSIRI